jgi:hypothetical protein
MELYENSKGGTINEIVDRLSRVNDGIQPPLVAYRYFPCESEAIVINKDSSQRIIFHGGTKFTTKEYESIADFKDYCHSNELSLNIYFDDPEILRFLQVSKYDFK